MPTNMTGLIIRYSLFLVLLLGLAGIALAQDAPHQEDETFTPHYAFSNYFGAGLYTSTGSNITVFNMPFSYQPEQEGDNVYRIRLPVSVGFYNFDLEDLDGFQPIEDAATLTLTVGIEFDHWVTENVMLRPFLDVGISENFKGNDRAVIYASGLESYSYFDAWKERHVWVARIQRAGYRTEKEGVTDGFSSFELGVDLMWPVRSKIGDQGFYYTNYFAAYWYMLDLAFDPETIDPTYETNAQEAGITIGFDKPLDFYLFTLDRIGLGYRYSKAGPDIIHLTVDFPLD